MNYRGTAVRLMVAALAVLLATTVASADDTKKPAAVGASKSATSSGTTAKPKPAAVQASTGKTLGELGEFSIATHIKVVEAYVPLKMLTNGTEVAHDLDKARVTVVGHDGIEATISFDEWSVDRPDFGNAGGVTALQILVEQKYFEYREGIGFVPTKNYLDLRGIKEDKPEERRDGSKNPNKQGRFMGVKDGPTLVEPGKPESVIKEPSQLGAVDNLFGETVDGNWETYNPDDPNTPEGKKKLLRNRLSELSQQCEGTPESREYWSCWHDCSNLLFSEHGKVTQDPVEECRRNCKSVFLQKKPKVCSEADGVRTELEQLRDD